MAERIFALTGKGGVGKTSLSALLVRVLAERYSKKRILAIDADPAVGLSTALGVEVEETVNDIRLKFIDGISAKKRSKASAEETISEFHYQVTNAVVDCGSFCFLAIGRPEGAGCYCSINSFLKEILSELTESFDYVVIDGEAGIEQVNRRVMEKVTDLILVSDASKKGIDVLKTIKSVAKDLDMYSRDYAVINRFRNAELKDLLNLEGLNPVGFIPEDEELALLDIKGESLMGLSADSETLKILSQVLDRMEEEGGSEK